MNVVDLMNTYGKKIYSENPNGLKLLGVCNEVSVNEHLNCAPDMTIKIDPTTDRLFYDRLYDMQSVYPQAYISGPYKDAADALVYGLGLKARAKCNMNEIKNVTIKMDEFNFVPIRLTVEWDSYIDKKTEFCTYGNVCISDTQKALVTCFIMHRIGIKKLIFNDDVTVAIWDKKDKTIVRRNENEDYDMDKAFYMCVVKHMIGEKKSLSNLLKKWTPDSQ